MRRRPLHWRQMRFGDLSAESVEALLSLVAAHRAPVVLVTEASTDAIRVQLGASPGVLASLTDAMRVIAPGVRLDETDATPDSDRHGSHIRAWWSGWPLLRADTPELSVAGLLGALAAVRGRERLRLSIRLQPGWLARPQDANRHHESKLAGGLLQAEIQLAISAESDVRARCLANGVMAALRTLSGPGAPLRLRRVTLRQAARSLGSSRRLVSVWWIIRPTTVLSPKELVAVIGWPVGGPRLTGLTYGRAPQLLAAAQIPRGGSGRTFGHSDATAAKRPLVQPVAGAVVHTLLVGPSGVGKSNLLNSLALDDISQGRGVIYLDLKGEIDDLLSRIPERRHKHVVVLEPGNGLPAPGLRLLRGSDPDLAADMLLATLKGIFRDSWGVRSDQYIGLGLRAVAHDPKGSLADLPVLYTNPAFRRKVLARVSDRRIREEFAAFEHLSAAQQHEHLGSPLNKITALLSRPVVRQIVAQESPKLDVAQALADRHVVVVGLSRGRLGASAQLIASLVLWELYAAALARPKAGSPGDGVVGVYLDEPTVLSGMPVPLDSMYELFRSTRTALTMTAQAISQMPREVGRAVLANASTLAVFTQNAEAEARLLAGALGRTVDAEDLQHLERYQLAVRLALANGLIAPLATARTQPLPPPIGSAEVLKRLSADRYGATLLSVDEALDRRHGITPDRDETTDDLPFGRRRRA